MKMGYTVFKALQYEANICETEAHGGPGKLARTLDIGQREAGFHTERQKAAYWDGRNQQGEAVGSGVYFYQLVTDDGYSPARKMLMTK